MAQSIFEIVESGKFDVTHKGNEVNLAIPQDLACTAQVFESEEALLTYCNEKKLVHTMLQKGFKQAIIDSRAVARPDEDTSINADGEKEKAQERLDKLEFKPMTKPGSGTKVTKAVQAKIAEIYSKMRATGMTDEEIEALLGQAQ